jgi:uncharacterized protein
MRFSLAAPTTIVLSLLAAALVMAPATALADAFDDGKEAWTKGRFGRSMAILLPLAEQGNAEAQYLVGTMYSCGQGVPQDRREAAKWFRLAAEHENPEAFLSLGQGYAMGAPDLPRDASESYFWMVLAIDGYKKLGRDADTAVQMRDLAAARLTAEQIAIAEERVEAWDAAH